MDFKNQRRLLIGIVIVVLALGAWYFIKSRKATSEGKTEGKDNTNDVVKKFSLKS